MTGTRGDRLLPPAAGNSPFDHSGWVVIANALGLVVALVALAVRVFIRNYISPPSKKDDVAAWIATAVGIVQAVLVFLQVNAGFGRTGDRLSRHSVERVQKLGYASDPLYLATLYMTKCSMGFLLLRITVAQEHQLLLRYGLFACAMLAFVSIILALTTCHISHPWDQYGEHCADIFPRWQAISAFDIATELAIFLTPVSFLTGLQMKFEQKLKVVLAFSSRLPLIAFCLLRLHHLREEMAASDPTLVGALTAVWAQTHMHYALIATTLPCVTPFLTTINTHLLTLELNPLTDTQSFGDSVSRDIPSRKQSHAEISTVDGSEDGTANSEVELVGRAADSSDTITPVIVQRVANLRDRGRSRP